MLPIYLLLLVVLILLNAFFAASELAVLSVSETALLQLRGKDAKKAELIRKLTKTPTSFLATIQIGVTLAGFLASAVAADTLSVYLVDALSWTAIPTDLLQAISIVLITLLLSLVTLIFGELVPKRIALLNPTRACLLLAFPLRAFSVVFLPVARFLSCITDGIVRLFGGKDAGRQTATEEEILSLLEEVRATGGLLIKQKDMIDNVFDLDDRDVAEVMTPRINIAAVPQTAKPEEILDLMEQTGFSRIPVYRRDLDHIAGVLYAPELFAANRHGRRWNLNRALHQPLFVPETLSCIQLLSQFDAKKKRLAIVVDEYGGTLGMVTMSDLLEAIVGQIANEKAAPKKEQTIRPLKGGGYQISGSASVKEVEDLFAVDFENVEHTTISGMLLAKLGTLPFQTPGQTLNLFGVQFTVNRADQKRILSVTAVKKGAAPPA